jgi:hypothetical protein
MTGGNEMNPSYAAVLVLKKKALSSCYCIVLSEIVCFFHLPCPTLNQFRPDVLILIGEISRAQHGEG